MDNRKPACIFDRDGTLFSVAHYRDADGEIESWHAYNGLAQFDAAIPLVAGLLNAVPNGITRIMTSGRMENVRSAFEAANRKNGVNVDLLLMRRDKDLRKDSIVKAEIYREKIEPFYRVLFAVDDRESVAQVWESFGIPVIRVVDPGILPRLFR